MSRATLADMFRDRQAVPIKNEDGEIAELIRVYYPGGWHRDYQVHAPQPPKED